MHGYVVCRFKWRKILYFCVFLTSNMVKREHEDENSCFAQTRYELHRLRMFGPVFS